MDMDNKGVVLLVDDDRFVLDATSMLLGIHGYRVISCEDPAEAASVLRDAQVDVVLADMRMPRMGGMELLGTVHAIRPCLPVLLMSGNAGMDTAVEAIKKGAFDLIAKPYRPEYLLICVERAIENSNLRKMEKMYRQGLEGTAGRTAPGPADAFAALKASSLEAIGRLAGAAEFRDAGPVCHASRVGLFAGRIAELMGMDSGFVETITFAAPMHDIGMTGVAEGALLKSGPLTASEFEAMKTHTMTGHRLLCGSSRESIQMAATIALTHHERWDGSGYPYGLKGGEIPLEGMIAMLCDRYDALRSSRPYKAPLGHSDSVMIITEGNERSRAAHFHPLVLGAFKRLAPEFDEIFLANLDNTDEPARTGLAGVS